MGDFRKKYTADWFRGGKACKDIHCTWEQYPALEKNIAHDEYNAEKKILNSYKSLRFL